MPTIAHATPTGLGSETSRRVRVDPAAPVDGLSGVTFEQMWRDLAPVGRAARAAYFRQPFTAAERECHRLVPRAVRGARPRRRARRRSATLVAWWRPAERRRTAGAVLTGSHLDSVLDGGAYDGPLGVVSALAAVDVLRDRRRSRRRGRSASACSSRRRAPGSAWPAWAPGSPPARRRGSRRRELARPRRGLLERRAWRGRPRPDRRLGDLLADVGCFVELHVEQGRDLVDRDAAGRAWPSAIWPHGRYRFDFTGRGQPRRHHPDGGPARPDADLRDDGARRQQAGPARRASARPSAGSTSTPNGTNAVPSRGHRVARRPRGVRRSTSSDAGRDDRAAGRRSAPAATAPSLRVTAESVSPARALRRRTSPGGSRRPARTGR